MKKQIIAIITGIIVAAMIVSLFFFVPWLQSQQDKEEAEVIRETQDNQ